MMNLKKQEAIITALERDEELVALIDAAQLAVPYDFIVKVGDIHVEVESYDFFPGDGRGRTKFSGSVKELKVWLRETAN